MIKIPEFLFFSNFFHIDFTAFFVKLKGDSSKSIQVSLTTLQVEVSTLMSTRPIQLSPSETVSGRPFTIPEGSIADIAVLQYMVDTLCRILQQPQAIPDRPRPLVLSLEEVGGRIHRIALAQPEVLSGASDLTVVGFCGQKRPNINREPVDAVDEKLINEFPRHKHLLSYSTLQLECGNSCNLVLFDHPQGLSHWAMSETHTQAVRLSPTYYTVVRLHNAVLPGGLMSNNKLILTRTKYFDFQDNLLF